jgi:hypothetical protein
MDPEACNRARDRRERHRLFGNREYLSIGHDLRAVAQKMPEASTFYNIHCCHLVLPFFEMRSDKPELPCVSGTLTMLLATDKAVVAIPKIVMGAAASIASAASASSARTKGIDFSCFVPHRSTGPELHLWELRS